MSILERLKEFCDFQEFEPPLTTPKDDLIPPNWPQQGRIDIQNVSIKYRKELPFVLKNLSLVIKPREKVAIVGKTGSGKSTLMLTLMRILRISEDAHQRRGSILIDGVDIEAIGLHTLRKNIAIIPQDPYLIEGTLRMNIDQLDEYSDSEICLLLKRLKFRESFGGGGSYTTDLSSRSSKRQKTLDLVDLLDLRIEANGGNLSAGQKQLVCIARALIQNTKILLMDEATASIDKKLDSAIQSLVLEVLRDTTVITIAHRLETVLGYHKVVVLQGGSVVEEGTARELSRKGGVFARMMNDSGMQRL